MDEADSKPGSSACASPQRRAPAPGRALVRHWRLSFRHLGLRRAMAELAHSTGRALKEFLPSRRQARFGDLDYDWEHEVDTTRSNVGLRAQLLAELAGRPYFATEPWLFDEMMRALALSLQQSAFSQGIVPAGLQDFTFVDLGSGKGRALLMAAERGFGTVIGVELFRELHLAAEQNILKFRARSGCVAHVRSLCMDALDFEFPRAPLVVYLFNPFTEATFREIMNRLRRSFEQAPRTIYLGYRFPEFEEVLSAGGWLEKVAGPQQWVLYRAAGTANSQALFR